MPLELDSTYHSTNIRENLRGVVTNAGQRHLYELELHSRYYVHFPTYNFGKVINLLTSSYGLIITTGLEVIFTNPSARAGYDTRSIFKRSLTGLNSEFSFF